MTKQYKVKPFQDGSDFGIAVEADDGSEFTVDMDSFRYGGIDAFGSVLSQTESRASQFEEGSTFEYDGENFKRLDDALERVRSKYRPGWKS